MARLTRTQKFAALREELANSSEQSHENNDLNRFQDKLNSLETAFNKETQTKKEDFNLNVDPIPSFQEVEEAVLDEVKPQDEEKTSEELENNFLKDFDFDDINKAIDSIVKQNVDNLDDNLDVGISDTDTDTNIFNITANLVNPGFEYIKDEPLVEETAELIKEEPVVEDLYLSPVEESEVIEQEPIKEEAIVEEINNLNLVEEYNDVNEQETLAYDVQSITEESNEDLSVVETTETNDLNPIEETNEVIEKSQVIEEESNIIENNETQETNEDLGLLTPVKEETIEIQEEPAIEKLDESKEENENSTFEETINDLVSEGEEAPAKTEFDIEAGLADIELDLEKLGLFDFDEFGVSSDDLKEEPDQANFGDDVSLFEEAKNSIDNIRFDDEIEAKEETSDDIDFDDEVNPVDNESVEATQEVSDENPIEEVQESEIKADLDFSDFGVLDEQPVANEASSIELTKEESTDSNIEDEDAPATLEVNDSIIEEENEEVQEKPNDENTEIEEVSEIKEEKPIEEVYESELPQLSEVNFDFSDLFGLDNEGVSETVNEESNVSNIEVEDAPATLEENDSIIEEESEEVQEKPNDENTEIEEVSDLNSNVEEETVEAQEEVLVESYVEESEANLVEKDFAELADDLAKEVEELNGPSQVIEETNETEEASDGSSPIEEESTDSNVYEEKIEDIQTPAIDVSSLLDSALKEVKSYNDQAGRASVEQISNDLIDELRHNKTEDKDDDDFSNTVTLEIDKVLSELNLDTISSLKIDEVLEDKKEVEPLEVKPEDVAEKLADTIAHPVLAKTLEEEPVEIKSMEETFTNTNTISLSGKKIEKQEVAEEEYYYDDDKPNKILNVILVILMVMLVAIIGVIVYYILYARGIIG